MPRGGSDSGCALGRPGHGATSRGSPLIIDFGYLRYNRYWWHNVRATFALAYRLRYYRLRYGHWPVYWYWDRKLPVPCGTICCHGDTHEEGCARAR